MPTHATLSHKHFLAKTIYKSSYLSSNPLCQVLPSSDNDIQRAVSVPNLTEHLTRADYNCVCVCVCVCMCVDKFRMEMEKLLTLELGERVSWEGELT